MGSVYNSERPKAIRQCGRFAGGATHAAPSSAANSRQFPSRGGGGRREAHGGDEPVAPRKSLPYSAAGGEHGCKHVRHAQRDARLGGRRHRFEAVGSERRARCGDGGSATKGDIPRIDNDVNTEFASLDGKVDALAAETKADVKRLDGKIDALATDTKANIARLETRMLMTTIVVAGIIVAAIKYLKLVWRRRNPSGACGLASRTSSGRRAPVRLGCFSVNKPKKGSTWPPGRGAAEAPARAFGEPAASVLRIA